MIPCELAKLNMRTMIILTIIKFLYTQESKINSKLNAWLFLAAVKGIESGNLPVALALNTKPVHLVLSTPTCHSTPANAI